jgi:uncharacterized glyoxalase superfamily protein PhnB
MPSQVGFMGVHLAVADMAASMAFYRLAGLNVPAGAGEHGHAEIVTGEGVHLAFSTPEVMHLYDAGWRGNDRGTSTVLQFRVDSRLAVDEMYASLTAARYHGHLPPTDAFWGSRYCEVDDPDGHPVGFHSPVDNAARS